MAQSIAIQSLLNQMQNLQSQINQLIEQENKKKTRIYTLYKNVQQSEEIRYKEGLDFTLPYYLVTLTFQPRKIFNRDFNGQFYILTTIMEEFNLLNYYCCFEKHKSEILHSHILIQTNDNHYLHTIFSKILYKLTDSTKNEPAIKCIPVKQTIKDIIRAFNYIFKDKPDHPIYKYIQINI